MADHFHLQCFRNCRSLRAEDRANRGDGDKNQDQGRCYRPHDLQRGIAMHLLGSWSPLTVTEFDDRVYEGYLDHHKDYRAPEEQTVPEEVDSSIELGVVIECRVRVVLRTRCKRQHEPGRQSGRDELPRAVVERHAGSVVTSLLWQSRSGSAAFATRSGERPKATEPQGPVQDVNCKSQGKLLHRF